MWSSGGNEVAAVRRAFLNPRSNVLNSCPAWGGGGTLHAIRTLTGQTTERHLFREPRGRQIKDSQQEDQSRDMAAGGAAVESRQEDQV